MVNLPWRLLPALLLLAAIMLQDAAARASLQSKDYQSVPAQPGENCTICNAPLDTGDVALIVRGRRVPLKPAMVDSFLQNQEKYFAAKQPRSALFQESLSAPSGVALGGIGSGWFWFGVYVLVALLFAGLSGYAAITKGLAPIPHFFIGLIFSLPGFLYVLFRKSQCGEQEVPPGLVKVPATRAPSVCPSCGDTNHPAARHCAHCGATLAPKVSSEVDVAS